MEQDVSVPAEERTPAKLARALRFFLTLALPIVLILVGVRLVMSETFVRYEYNKPHFPPDPYGFTQDDRRRYAPLAVQYLLNDAGIEFLADLTFDDGAPLYNERELAHMADVKVVTRGAMRTLAALSLLVAATALFMAARPPMREELRRGLAGGAALTWALMALIILLASVGWDVFFVGFHRIFFQGDSWLFPNSDTLIRLFPEQFWFDAAVAIGALAALGAAALGGISWLWGRRAQAL